MQTSWWFAVSSTKRPWRDVVITARASKPWTVRANFTCRSCGVHCHHDGFWDFPLFLSVLRWVLIIRNHAWKTATKQVFYWVGLCTHALRIANHHYNKWNQVRTSAQAIGMQGVTQVHACTAVFVLQVQTCCECSRLVTFLDLFWIAWISTCTALHNKLWLTDKENPACSHTTWKMVKVIIWKQKHRWGKITMGFRLEFSERDCKSHWLMYIKQ